MSRTLLLVGLVGCSFGKNPEPCADDQTCRDAFGLGSVCAADGFCSDAVPNPRCATTEPPDVFERPTKYADHYVIGSMFDVTTDAPQTRSVELAVGQVNDLGGLEGNDFVVVSCTYEEDPALDDLTPDLAAIDLVDYFVNTLGVSAIIGPATSDRAIDAYNAASPEGVLVISPSATSPALTEIDGLAHDDANPGLFWRTVPPDDLQGATVAWDLEDRGVTSVAVVAQDSSYASALADAVEENYGGSVARFTFANPTSLSEAITDAGNAGVQEVVFLSSDVGDIVAFFGAAAVSNDFNGADPIEIFLADAGADPFLLANTSDLSALYDRVRGTRPTVPQGDVFEQFQAAYASVYNEDPADAVFAPYTYDAAWLAIYGHAWSLYQEDEISGIGIARGLRQVSAPAGGELPVRPGSWELVLGKFKGGAAVNLEGASGPLDFDPLSGETVASIEVWVINPAGTGFVAVTVCDPDGTCTDV